MHRLSCPMAGGIFLDQGSSHVLCIDRWILNHWTPGKSSAVLLIIARAVLCIQQYWMVTRGLCAISLRSTHWLCNKWWDNNFKGQNHSFTFQQENTQSEQSPLSFSPVRVFSPTEKFKSEISSVRPHLFLTLTASVGVPKPTLSFNNSLEGLSTHWELVHCNGWLQGKDTFPGESDGQEFTYNAGYMGSIPGLGRSPGEGNGNPLQYSCLENSMDRGAWCAIVLGVIKSWTRQSN